MSIIFSASSDQMSFSHSSRIIAPLVRWLLPHISDQSVHAIVFAIRKAAHVTEYAILGLLVWRALPNPSATNRHRWLWSQAGVALLVVALYAVSDEIHQAFVPTRQASVWDVVLDTTGGAFGLLFLWFTGRWRKRW